ncbi:MAG: hypothetical protein ACR2QO_17560 [Acidimicrobiales bacterium]
MSKARNPSGLPSGLTRVPKNRLSRALDRNPTAETAIGGFAAYCLGMLFVMASVFAMIAGLAMLVEGEWGAWQGRAAGAGFILGGAAVFAGGRWLMEECAIQRRH